MATATDRFNNWSGDLAVTLLAKYSQNPTLRRPPVNTSGGFFSGITTSVKKLPYEAAKAAWSYNIKVTIYNVATALLISSVVSLIFALSSSAIVLGVGCLATRSFVHQALDETAHGSLFNFDQGNVILLIFKQFSGDGPRPTREGMLVMGGTAILGTLLLSKIAL